MRCGQACCSWACVGPACQAVPRGCPEQAALPTELLSPRIGGQCHEISTVLDKTDEPGKYTSRESRGPSRAAPVTRGHTGACQHLLRVA